MRPVACTTGMTPASDPNADLAALWAEVAHLRRVNEELLVTEPRATVERQQAHIDRLVRLTFGRKSERVVSGPTLFDDIPDPDPPHPAPLRPSRRCRGPSQRSQSDAVTAAARARPRCRGSGSRST